MLWRVLLGRGDLWFLTAAYSVLGYIAYIYLSWFYLYLVNVRDFSVLHGGMYSAVPFVPGTVAALVGGWFSDHLSQRFGKRVGRCGLGLGSLLLSAGLICAGAAAKDPYRALLFLSPGAGALLLGVAAYFATTIDLAPAYTGTVGGFMNMGGTWGAPYRRLSLLFLLSVGAGRVLSMWPQG